MNLLFLIVCFALAGLVLVLFGLKNVKGKSLDYKYSPDLNRFQARGEVKPSAARHELIKAVTAEEQAIHDFDNRDFRRYVESRQTEVLLAQTSYEKKFYQLQEQLVDMASINGWDIETLKRRQLDQLEIQKLADQTRLALANARAYLLAEYDQLRTIRETLDTLYDREEQLQARGDYKKLAQVKADIKMYERDAKARRGRLVQGVDRKELR